MSSATFFLLLLGTIASWSPATLGDRIEPRIVGGQLATDEQFPFQVSVRYRNSHICGGSIISPNFILTAAHCLSKRTGSSWTSYRTRRISVRVGSESKKRGGHVIKASELRIHANYSSLRNDIALIKLEKPLELSSAVKTIQLAMESPEEGSHITISGWGLLSHRGEAPTFLYHHNLTALSDAECSALFSFNTDRSILCLGHEVDNGACQGDSGGPAVFQERLVGVANFVINGCGSEFPDGYASVAAFRSWIIENSDYSEV